MIASDVIDLCASTQESQKLPDDFVVVIGPIPVPFKLPTINEISDDIDSFWRVLFEKRQEFQEFFYRRVTTSQMYVRYEQSFDQHYLSNL